MTNLDRVPSDVCSTVVGCWPRNPDVFVDKLSLWCCRFRWKLSKQNRQSFWELTVSDCVPCLDFEGVDPSWIKMDCRCVWVHNSAFENYKYTDSLVVPHAEIKNWTSPVGRAFWPRELCMSPWCHKDVLNKIDGSVWNKRHLSSVSFTWDRRQSVEIFSLNLCIDRVA